MASDDIREFLTALSVAGVDFLVVGAHALAAHGHVRATGDIDGRMRSEIEGVPVHVIGFSELVSAKRASARMRAPGSNKAVQDEADLAWLLATREQRRRR